MELVTILRNLWRWRTLVACAALVAVLVGTAVAYRISFPPRLESRKYEVGVATARILVDTPSSQVVEVAPKGSDTLGVRANLLASLMVDGVVKTAIASRAGLRPEDLLGSTGDDPPPPSRPRANLLTTRVMTNTAGDQLPIIEISTQSPDAAGAARLANAAITGLRDYLDSQAAVEKVANAHRLRVSGLGGAQARQAVRGPKDVFAVAATIFVFLTLNGLILASIALIRGWRVAAEEDLEGAEVRDDRPHWYARESAGPAERSDARPWANRIDFPPPPPTSASDSRAVDTRKPRAKPRSTA
jgi:hypothetical protein